MNIIYFFFCFYWFLLFIGESFLLVSVINLAVSTLPQFRHALSPCQYRQYMAEVGKVDTSISSYFKSHDCQNIKPVHDPDGFFLYLDYSEEDFWYEYYSQEEHTTPSLNTTLINQENKSKLNASKSHKLNISLPNIKLKNQVFYSVNFIKVAFFTLELLLRVTVCSSIQLFFWSFLTAVNTVVLIGTYIDILMVNLRPSYKYETGLSNII